MKNKKRFLSTAIAGTLAAAILVGGATFAYLKDTSKEITNTFNANSIAVTLTEKNSEGNEEEAGNSYEIIPGTSDTKDPKVNITNTVKSYVFVKVTDTVNTANAKDVVDYSIDSSNWTVANEVSVEGATVYYKVVDVVLDSEDNPTTQTFHVLANDKVTYKDNTNAGSTANGGELKFQAYAVQYLKETAEGVDKEYTVSEAWTAAQTTTP